MKEIYAALLMFHFYRGGENMACSCRHAIHMQVCTLSPFHSFIKTMTANSSLRCPKSFVRTPTALQMMNIYATRDSTLDSDNNLQPTSTLPQSAPTDCRMQTAQNSQ